MNGVIFGLIAIGIVFALFRLIKGPSTFDRVVGVDTMNIIITGTIVFIAYLFENSLYLDIAMVYGILAFLETVVISRYLEGRQ